MEIAVIDGQGGGLGKAIIVKLIEEIGGGIHITAVGTNVHATNNMLKASSSLKTSDSRGIYGEESILSFLKNNKIDCIIGPIGIICNGGINGEITAAISEAIFRKQCTKYLIPLKKHGLYIPGTTSIELKDFIQEIILEIKASSKK